MSLPNQQPPDSDLPKQQVGLARLWRAVGHSLAGLAAAWSEAAFRLEVFGAIVLLPTAVWLADNWVEGALLAGSVVLVMIAELLNTAVEAAVDRIGLQRHPLSKRAKDIGSAAVLLSATLCGGIWVAALWQRFGP